jgi:hypothetical protein
MIWCSVEGERFVRGPQGEDIPLIETLGDTLGQSKVLTPKYRPPQWPPTEPAKLDHHCRPGVFERPTVPYARALLLRCQLAAGNVKAVKLFLI